MADLGAEERAEIDELIDRLNDRDPYTRAKAIEALRKRAGSAVDALLPTLQRESAYYAARNRRFRRWKAVAGRASSLYPLLIASGISTFALRRFGLRLPHESVYFVDICLIVIWWAISSVTIVIPRPTRALKAYLAVVASSDDKRIVGPLLEAGSAVEGAFQTDVLAAMTRILGGLAASDKHLLSPEQYQCLLESLRPWKMRGWKKYLLAALRAIEQIGDEKAVPVVERLHGRMKSDPIIEEACTRCLEFLRERADEERIRSTLLRPAADSAPDELLRPASASDTQPTAVLLRPTDSD